ncbi:MAG: hypothetical protein ACD_39C01169G0001 [uncultured bacterium]|nr:MAG: hypothetical protein ACD_39C01169G0001 [uncultured bacterium]
MSTTIIDALAGITRRRDITFENLTNRVIQCFSKDFGIGILVATTKIFDRNAEGKEFAK